MGTVWFNLTHRIFFCFVGLCYPRSAYTEHSKKADDVCEQRIPDSSAELPKRWWTHSACEVDHFVEVHGCPGAVRVVVACTLALASARYDGPLAGGQPASLYPAGVDPAACPNFPPLQQPRRGPPQYQPQQYSAPVSQYNPVYSQQYAPAPQQYSAEVQNALNRGEYIGDGDYHGEGLAEALAPWIRWLQVLLPLRPSAGQALGIKCKNMMLSVSVAQRRLCCGRVRRQWTGTGTECSCQAYSAPSYNPAAQYSATTAYNSAPAQYAPQAQPAQVPAGVSPHACPNYPFCH
ncbi:hypothetical protein NQ318_008607 [Aromia moschata]|uniref:Cuticle protein CPCFC domain-containing protein n=1 Tax=Aromia moschata TaxID=1265417 RepID=A0AAV8YYB2_9CUCU|nr:hypothetical protein NQ318_008607 [Aromia moschata]